MTMTWPRNLHLHTVPQCSKEVYFRLAQLNQSETGRILPCSLALNILFQLALRVLVRMPLNIDDFYSI